MRHFRLMLLCMAAVLAFAMPLRAERTILADDYLDKLRGMWLGELIGNTAGRPTEGSVVRGGLNISLNWQGLASTTTWVGEDDTCFEYMYLQLLKQNPQPTGHDIADTWRQHVPVPGFWVANRQTAWRVNEGRDVPASGSIRYNTNWFAIDSQITTESLGAAVPGMRQQAADLAGLFGSASNDGFALHAAQFYAAMYSAAAFESDIPSLVSAGLEVVPTDSLTWRVIQDVRDLYQADQAAGRLSDPQAWRAAQTVLYDKYYTQFIKEGRYHAWVDSSVNTAMTTLALLYGQGDLERTVEIGVLAGFDNDCNPATAGGLVGMVKGFSGLPQAYHGAGDAYALDTRYDFATLHGLAMNSTVSQIALDWQAVSEAKILAAGGTISGTGAGRTYTLAGEDTVTTPASLPVPTGPAGLAGAVLALGKSVTPTASVTFGTSENQQKQLWRIIDGVTDVSRSGIAAYHSDDGINAQPAGGDFYGIKFGRKVSFAPKA